MYKKEFCKEKQIEPVKLFVFKGTVHSYDPQLAFYKLKKEQCMKCNIYNYFKDKTNW